MSDSIEDIVIQWINSNVNKLEAEEIVGSTPLVEKQILDSLQIMDLVMFLEGNFSIQIPLDALTESNFETPAAITAMTQKILGGD